MTMQLVSQAFTESFMALEVGVAIAHENVNFNPANDEPFCTLNLLPDIGESLMKNADGQDQVNGIFQVSFYVPSGTSTGQILGLVDQVLAFYNHNRVLEQSGQFVQINNGGRNGGRNADGWYIIDISITWFAYINRQTIDINQFGAGFSEAFR